MYDYFDVDFDEMEDRDIWAWYEEHGCEEDPDLDILDDDEIL